MRKLCAVLAIVVGSSAYSEDMCFPENDLHLQDGLLKSNITEDQFNGILDKFETIFTPVLENLGGKLSMNRKWKSDTVNASASRFGSRWNLNMYGGLARRPEVTPDGFALVVCHELGHHIAGFAFKGSRWAANEGQSDYYATHVCTHMIWADEPDENARYRSWAPSYVKQRCDHQWAQPELQNICYRSAAAGMSLASLLATLQEVDMPAFETPDTSVVSETDDTHPAAQCRLDTYFSGALCPAGFDTRIIPGLDHPDGQQSAGAEEIAAANSCHSANGHQLGIRPKCWFKPGIE